MDINYLCDFMTFLGYVESLTCSLLYHSASCTSGKDGLFDCPGLCIYLPPVAIYDRSLCAVLVAF